MIRRYWKQYTPYLLLHGRPTGICSAGSHYSESEKIPKGIAKRKIAANEYF
jgi:hypothetical protein